MKIIKKKLTPKIKTNLKPKTKVMDWGISDLMNQNKKALDLLNKRK